MPILSNALQSSAGPTRRRLLIDTAKAIAAAAALMPPSVQKVLAQETSRRGSFRDIKHVVMLMQENRSFDHYYGTLSGVRGFDDPHAITLDTGKSVFYQPDDLNPKGYTLPFHLNTLSSSAQKIPSTSHAWAVQHEAWAGGRMDRWLPAHRKADGVNGPYVMGYYTRADIPFQFALAESFTLCDSYFCSVMGPTWPNRMYWMTGMIDPEGTGGGPILRNVAPPGVYTWTTYAERLERAGVSWKVYQQEDGHGHSMLQNFKVFRDAPAASPLLPESDGARSGRGSSSYDARNDKLPAVSWICPTSFQNEHPDHMPADGAAFVASKIDAIASNPDVWAKTAFILNYDENDGALRPRAASIRCQGNGWRVCGRAADWRRIPGALSYRVAVDRGRVGCKRTVRPHVGAAVPWRNLRACGSRTSPSGGEKYLAI